MIIFLWKSQRTLTVRSYDAELQGETVRRTRARIAVPEQTNIYYFHIEVSTCLPHSLINSNQVNCRLNERSTFITNVSIFDEIYDGTWVSYLFMNRCSVRRKNVDSAMCSANTRDRGFLTNRSHRLTPASIDDPLKTIIHM